MTVHPGARLRGRHRLLTPAVWLVCACVAGASAQGQRAQRAQRAQSAQHAAASLSAESAPDSPSDSVPLVPVAARRLSRGAVLTAADITMARADARHHPADGAQRPEPGWVARRVVLAGEVLREPAVAPAPLVGAGQPVRYELTHEGIRLSLEGVATSAASLGERVTVRLGARRRVTGIVAGPARVVATDSSRTS